MSSLKIAVCDDNKGASGLITATVKSSFEAAGAEVETETFHNAAALEQRFHEVHFKIVFLDIEMPREDGISCGRRLRRIDSDVVLIYVSGREDRVFETFEVQPFGFVRKSNFLGDIEEVVSRYMSSHEAVFSDKTLVFTRKGNKFRVSMSDIMYIEGGGMYQRLYLHETSEPLEIDSRMEKLEEELAEYGFMRVHKGYLVNFFYIKSIERSGEILLSDGRRIPVSRRRKNDVKQEYLDLCRKFDIFLF